MLSRVPGSLVNIAQLSKKARKGTSGGDTVADTINSHVPVPSLAVNELAMNLASQRVDHGYLKVLIVAEALVAEVPGNFSAMSNRFCICLELDPNCIPMRDTIFHIEEKLLHAVTSGDTKPVCQDSFRTLANSTWDIGAPNTDRTPKPAKVRDGSHDQIAFAAIRSAPNRIVHCDTDSNNVSNTA
jgi:hypothetical protein